MSQSCIYSINDCFSSLISTSNTTTTKIPASGFEGLITLSFVTSTRVLGTVQEHGSIEFTEAITKLLCTTFIKATRKELKNVIIFDTNSQFIKT